MKDIEFAGYHGVTLRGKIWETGNASASLLIVHGFGEHGTRYKDFAEFLNQKNISVMAYDNRGHGRSDGKRGVILNWNEYREDISLALAELGNYFPDIPAFLMGHSLGGTMVLDYVLANHDLPRGVICSAPALGKPAVSPFLLAIGRVLSKLVPQITLNAGLETAALSRDNTIVEEYIADPLVHGKGSARLSTELTATQNRIFAEAGMFPCPLLLSYGSDDRIAPRPPIERFFELAGTSDKELRIFEGSYHEIHNDLDKSEVYQVYSEWIRART